MRKINLAWFCQLNAALNPIAERNPTDVPKPDNVYDLYQAKEFLTVLTGPAMPLSLKASRPQIDELLEAIDVVLETDGGEKRIEALQSNAFKIYFVVKKLITVLESELAVQPVYHVWPKRAYDTDVLSMDGARIFSEGIRKRLDDKEVYDITQGCKCLAFEVPTAATFHLLRATESVMRRYYASITGKSPKVTMRNWGAYLKLMKQEPEVDRKVVYALEQIKDLYRNPVIHPETQIELEEALSLLGVVESAISAMFAAMPANALLPTTLTGLLGISKASQPS